MPPYVLRAFDCSRHTSLLPYREDSDQASPFELAIHCRYKIVLSGIFMAHSISSYKS